MIYAPISTFSLGFAYLGVFAYFHFVIQVM